MKYQDNMDTKTIILMNGNTLECVVGKKFESKTDTEIHINEGKVLPVFENFAHFLLENADRIMSDSRMFLSPIYSQVFFPWFSESRPRLGTFIEWWTQFPENSRDNDGNPIYYISGNPLTGSHACYSIGKSGKSRIARERRFHNILSSFSSVNKRYMDVKADGEYYEFDEVLKILCGDTYQWRTKAVNYKVMLEITQRKLSQEQKRGSDLEKKLNRVMHENREIIFEGLKEQIIDFSERYGAMEEAYIEECHKQGKLKKEESVRFQNGELSLEEYDTLRRQSSKERGVLKKELSDMGIAFMKKYFSRNPNEVNLKMVLDYAKHQKRVTL